MTDVPQGKQTVTDDEIVCRMESDPDPAFTTPELAEIFGMTTEGIRGRLEKLRAEGAIEKKKPTSRTVIWWTHADERDVVSSA